MSKFNPIDLNIDEEGDPGFVKRIKSFNIAYPRERKQYEALINNPDIVIISDLGPNYDKTGKATYTVRWWESVDSPALIEPEQI